MDKNLHAIKNAKLTAQLKPTKKEIPKEVEQDQILEEFEVEEELASPDEEEFDDYKIGGYHPIYIGDKLKDNRYTIIRKLGWGHFSTVWLAKDEIEKRYCAIKVVKSASQYTEAAKDEIELLLKVTTAKPTSPGRDHVVSLLDHFEIQGPNGTHICMVLEVLGENLLGLIRRFPRGLPKKVVKAITHQVLKGLDYLHHHCGIIHTDLKPENVLIYVGEVPMDSIPVQKDERLNEYVQCSFPLGLDWNFDWMETVTDSESVTPRSRTRSRTKSKAKYLDNCNENESTNSNNNLISSNPNNYNNNNKKNDEEEPYEMDEVWDRDYPILVKVADLGNACWIHRHFTDGIQTRQYRAPEVILGAPWNETTDLWSLACMVVELLTGDYLFEPHSGSRFDKNDDHLAQIIELLGPLPKSLLKHGRHTKDFFNKKGQLKRITHLKYWDLHDVLIEKYQFSYEDTKQLCSLLLPMLEPSIDKRARAHELLGHPWLRF